MPLSAFADECKPAVRIVAGKAARAGRRAADCEHVASAPIRRNAGAADTLVGRARARLLRLLMVSMLAGQIGRAEAGDRLPQVAVHRSAARVAAAAAATSVCAGIVRLRTSTTRRDVG